MPDPSANTLIADITGRADLADRTDGCLLADVASLREAGWLRACLPTIAGGSGWGCEPGATEAAFLALRNMGRANLSVARLFEGHMNAAKLVDLYAAPALRDRVFADVRDGVMLGVWGADTPARPLALEVTGDQLVLVGGKRFASGLGVIGAAVVIARMGEGVQMLVVPADDPARADAQPWRMAGMRATRSGEYDFGGLKLGDDARLGQAGDYTREPHFEGGVWRYCAAHLGAAEALHTAMIEALVASGRQDDPHQRDRIVRAAIAIETARLWILRAAYAVEAKDADPQKAALALLAREVTERSCLAVIAQCERALGMAAHVEGTAIERIRRDLALFVCQAAPDAKRARAAAGLIAAGGMAEAL